MKKSVLGLFVTVVVLALLFGEKNYVPEGAEENIYQAKVAESVTNLPEEEEIPEAGYGFESDSFSEIEYEFVKAAEFPQEGNVIIIEDEDVPLAAVPEVKKADVQPEKNADAQTEKKADVPSEKAEVQPKKKVTPVPVEAEPVDTTSQSNLEDLGGGVRGYYDEEAASTLLAQINVMRSGSKETPALSAELNDVARRRALSCVKDFSHNGMETASECMAIGQQDAAAVITSWYASDDHRTFISDPAYTQAGAACIKYDKGNGQMQTIWVLVLN